MMIGELSHVCHCDSTRVDSQNIRAHGLIRGERRVDSLGDQDVKGERINSTGGELSQTERRNSSRGQHHNEPAVL